MEHVLDHSKSDFGLDAHNPGYFDSLSTSLDYLQYPQSPFGVAMGCK